MSEARRWLGVRPTKDGFQGRSMMVLDRFYTAEREALPDGSWLVTELGVGETPDQQLARHKRRVHLALAAPRMQFLLKRRVA